ncbi:MAG: cyclic nucleotide-binding domain-containing protein [Sandaracinaceae bacterium]
MRPLPMVGGMLETVVRALGRSDLFGSLTPEQLRSVAQRGELFQVAEGEEVMRQGEPSDAFHLVLSGQAVVRRSHTTDVAYLGPDDVVGEMGVLLGRPRTATVVANAPTVLLRFEGPVLEAMFERVPGFGLEVCRALAQRLQDVTDLIQP